jgi:hypothetical protein
VKSAEREALSFVGKFYFLPIGIVLLIAGGFVVYHKAHGAEGLPPTVPPLDAPLLVLGPMGESFQACGMKYEVHPLKTITFRCCPGDCDIFRDGFEQ